MNKKVDIRKFRKGLRVIEREIMLKLRRETGCCGVSFAQCHLLLALDQAPEAGVQELSEMLCVDKANVSRTVDSLVEADLIVRETETGDRRRVSVRLSEKGRDKTASIHELCDCEYVEFFDALKPGERKKVTEAVALLADVLSRRRGTEQSAACCGAQGEGK